MHQHEFNYSKSKRQFEHEKIIDFQCIGDVGLMLLLNQIDIHTGEFLQHLNIQYVLNDEKKLSFTNFVKEK